MKTEKQFKNKLEIILDQEFPKKRCKERSQALVLFSFAVLYHKELSENVSDEARAEVGEPPISILEENMNPKQEKLIGTLIRDITKVGFMAKSEVRRRINEILKQKEEEEYRLIANVLKNQRVNFKKIRQQDKENFIKGLEEIRFIKKDKPKHWDSWHIAKQQGYIFATDEFLKRIKNLIKAIKENE